MLLLRMARREVLRAALLQHQLGRADPRLEVEALAQGAVRQHVADRRQRHSLVMRHVGADDGERLASRQTLAGEVDRLVEAVASARAELRETTQIAQRLAACIWQCERGGVRCDDEIRSRVRV